MMLDKRYGRRAPPALLIMGVAALRLISGARVSAQNERQASQETAPAEAVEYVYRLAAGDRIEIRFTYNEELNLDQTIRPDGRIALELVGEVQADGRTPAELTSELESRFARYLKHAEITVIVRDFAGRRVYVGGEVTTPGVIELQGRMTVLQAILNSGGAKTSGGMKDVVLLRRREDGGAEVTKVNISEVLDGKVPDVVLQPFDAVFVPRSGIANVGLFVEQYVNAIIPRAVLIAFGYDFNNAVTISAPRP